MNETLLKQKVIPAVFSAANADAQLRQTVSNNRRVNIA